MRFYIDYGKLSISVLQLMLMRVM